MVLSVTALIVALVLAIMSIPGVSGSFGLRGIIDSWVPFWVWTAVAIVIVLVQGFTILVALLRLAAVASGVFIAWLLWDDFGPFAAVLGGIGGSLALGGLLTIVLTPWMPEAAAEPQLHREEESTSDVQPRPPK